MTLRAGIVGGASWNTLVFVERFPEPHPQTVFARDMHRTLGSSGAGKAMNFRSLGAEAVLWALVGDDDEGDRVRQRLGSAGVEFHAHPDPAGTAQHINLMNHSGDRISIFGNAGSLDAEIDPGPMRPVLEGVDLVSITIMNHCRPFLRLAADLPSDIWIDIHDYDGANPHHDEFIEFADVLIMSSVAMSDWRSFLEDRIDRGATIAIATHGAAGASGITQSDGWIDIPASPASPVDSNGAGDAFMAAFAVEWYRGGDLAGSMTAGADHAARAVESLELAPGIP